MIQFNQVSKRYPGGYEALKNLSFQIETGELVFLAGHSGAGKSTLLKLIAGIDKPRAGSGVVHGPKLAASRRGAVPSLRRPLGL
ncbi:MAG: ATP-binding cassette domain-containing protein, partial [Chitinimonas sp.]|nr:ATP-binding cassette domain-containing protein [Chitinimonas sp.]